jgi:hypothetical protein
MSKHEWLTKEEMVLAVNQGWNLHHVFNMDTNRWTLNVLPVQFTPTIGATHATALVIQQAQLKNPVCIKALRLITQFNQKAH